jgi:hypothetical protein
MGHPSRIGARSQVGLQVLVTKQLLKKHKPKIGHFRPLPENPVEKCLTVGKLFIFGALHLKPQKNMTLDDINFKDKTALVRVDFNVPLDESFNVTDTNRIEAAKPTIIKILEDGGRAVLMSHLGRPKGKVNPDLSLSHIADAVSEIIGVQTKFVQDCVGPQVA